MKIKKSVFDIIVHSYSAVPPEEGGILGTYENIVCTYFHDKGRKDTSFAIYEPNVDTLNKVLSLWNNKGICFGGIIHSHLPKQNVLSKADIDYIKSVFINIEKREELYFPVFLPDTQEFIPYLVTQTDDGITIRIDQLIVIDD